MVRKAGRAYPYSGHRAAPLRTMRTRAIANKSEIYVEPEDYKARLDGMPDEIFLRVSRYLSERDLASMMRLDNLYNGIAGECIYSNNSNSAQYPSPVRNPTCRSMCGN
jgi:hypothetical protein